MDDLSPNLATHKWLLEHSVTRRDACLRWPWFCDPGTGYGRVGVRGKIRYAHRVMCELVNGPPPTPKHQATHNCGHGSQGCVNPRHLVWKTNKENQMDRAAHGTMRKKGSRRFVLTPEMVAEIRAIGDKETKTALAKRFGTSRDSIAKILDGRSWRKPGQYDTGFGPTGDPSNPALHRKSLSEYAAEHLREMGADSIYGNDHVLIRAITIRAGRDFRGEGSRLRLLGALEDSPLFLKRHVQGATRSVRCFDLADQSLPKDTP